MPISAGLPMLTKLSYTCPYLCILYKYAMVAFVCKLLVNVWHIEMFWDVTLCFPDVTCQHRPAQILGAIIDRRMVPQTPSGSVLQGCRYSDTI